MKVLMPSQWAELATLTSPSGPGWPSHFQHTDRGLPALVGLVTLALLVRSPLARA
jgi:hypothetical protein